MTGIRLGTTLLVLTLMGCGDDSRRRDLPDAAADVMPTDLGIEWGPEAAAPISCGDSSECPLLPGDAPHARRRSAIPSREDARGALSTTTAMARTRSATSLSRRVEATRSGAKGRTATTTIPRDFRTIVKCVTARPTRTAIPYRSRDATGRRRRRGRIRQLRLRKSRRLHWRDPERAGLR